MLHTLGYTTTGELLADFPLEEIHTQDFKWFWVDFDQPSEEEKLLLTLFFRFHPLAVEDCLNRLQRPKLDYYDDFSFFVFHSICNDDMEAEELDLFLGKNFVVTFHLQHLREMQDARDRIMRNPEKFEYGPKLVAYQIIDQVVDEYFPILYKIEDQLNEIEESLSPTTVHLSMDYVFDVRSDLLRLRRTIYPMRDLLYRILNSERIGLNTHEKVYFGDIYDHLLRLSEMVDSSRELTADIRDSQLSINSNQMNRIMMILTIISSIFIPLTFIAGVYGMNFSNMPELQWKYGYFIVMGIMLLIFVGMLLWFRHKGWLRIFKS